MTPREMFALWWDMAWPFIAAAAVIDLVLYAVLGWVFLRAWLGRRS